MQYNFHGFSQDKLLEFGLDDRDAALLRYFVDFKDSGHMYSEEVNGETYYWVKYEAIRQELPIVGQHFKKDALYRRFKQMAEKGILKHHHKKSGGSFSYYTIGPKYAQLITSTELPTQPEIPFAASAGAARPPSGSKTGGSDPKTVPSDPKTGGSDFTTGGATDVKSEGYGSRIGAKDPSSKDPSSKKIRESEQSSPALALFFEKFPNAYLSKRRKKDIIETVTNLDAWKFTLWWWDVKEYQAEYSENMLDHYLKKAIPRLTQVQTQEQPQKETRRQESLFVAADAGNGNGHDPLWNAVMQGLQKRINPTSFNTWIHPITLLGRHDQTVQIGVPEEVFAYWLQEHYQAIIKELLAVQLGFQPTLEFVVKSQPKQAD